MNNEIKVEMCSKSQNESFARIAISAFITPLDPTINEVTEIKTAISEAVTNAIIHGYEDNKGKIYLHFSIVGDELMVKVKDNGKGIENIEQAMTALYTSKPDMERSGLGFTVMENFMDRVEVKSVINEGTEVIMYKKMNR